MSIREFLGLVAQGLDESEKQKILTRRGRLAVAALIAAGGALLLTGGADFIYHGVIREYLGVDSLLPEWTGLAVGGLGWLCIAGAVLYWASKSEQH